MRSRTIARWASTARPARCASLSRMRRAPHVRQRSNSWGGAGPVVRASADAPGAACTAEIEFMEAACNTGGAKEVFVTDDPDEGELFVAGRRAAFPVTGDRGALPPG